jgi:hypothetical protein
MPAGSLGAIKGSLEGTTSKRARRGPVRLSGPQPEGRGRAFCALARLPSGATGPREVRARAGSGPVSTASSLLAHQFVESRSFQPIEIALAGTGLSQEMFGYF